MTPRQDYFGARYFSGERARFTTVDPFFAWGDNLVDPQRWNRYAYAKNNPAAGNTYAQHHTNGGWDNFSVRDLAAATAGGVVSGALAGMTMGGSVAGTVVAGGWTNVAGGMVERSLDSRAGGTFDRREMVFDGAAGALAGAWGAIVGHIVSKPVAQLEKTAAEAAQRAVGGGKGSYMASKVAKTASAQAAEVSSKADVYGTVAGAKFGNFAQPVARARYEKSRQQE